LLQLLRLHFDVIKVKRGQGNYTGINMHLRIDNFDCEVQLRGSFEHSFYQINHKFNYKLKGASLRSRSAAALPLPQPTPSPH
jgi:hypothetical protein